MAKSRKVLVSNLANQPREFKIAGKWYRWSPRSQAGHELVVDESVVKHPDFEGISQYFTVTKTGGDK